MKKRAKTNRDGYEVRYRPAGSEEIRLDGDEGNTLTGLAIPYNSWSEWMPDFGGGKWRERFEANPVDWSESDDVLVTREHDNRLLLGRTASGTATLQETERGLSYVVDPLPDSPNGQETRVQIKRGDLNGSSFEFRVKQGGESWSVETDEAGAEIAERTIKSGGIILRQVGPVAKPFYGKDTAVALRSLESARKPSPVVAGRSIASLRRERLLTSADD